MAIGITFDLNAALKAAENDPALHAFLTEQADRFESLTADSILTMLTAWLFGKRQDIVTAFIGPLPDQATALVGNAADLAARQADAGTRLTAVATVAVQLILDGLRAGLVVTGL